jgi:hypothetical protein
MRLKLAYTIALMSILGVAALAGLAVSERHLSTPVARQSTNSAQMVTVRGVVTDAQSSAPLPGVQVALTGGTPPLTFVASTGTDGTYSISQVPEGSYSVTFSKVGFVTLHHGQTSPFSPSKRLEVRMGANNNNVSAALPRARAIEGRVTDASGSPILDAIVQAYRLEYVNREPRLTAVGRRAFTDDRGIYRLFGLPEGDYYVRAAMGAAVVEQGAIVQSEARGYAPVFFPGTWVLEDAIPIRIPAGQDVLSVDIALRLVRLARVSGRVAAPHGAIVTLVRASHFPSSIASVTTNDQGEFWLTGIPPGAYIVQARSVPGDVADRIARTGSSKGLNASEDIQFGTATVVVDGSDVEGVVVHTERPGSILGLITTGGQPISPSGSMAVIAVPAAPDALTSGSGRARVQSDGTFALHGLLGRFVLRVQGSADGPPFLGSVTLGGSDVSDEGITVVSGQPTTGVTIDLADAPATLAGRVTGCEIEVRCDVIAFAEDSRLWGLPASRYVVRTMVKAGAYRMALPAGSYRVAVVKNLPDGAEADTRVLEQLSRSTGSQAIALRDGQTRTMDINGSFDR